MGWPRARLRLCGGAGSRIIGHVQFSDRVAVVTGGGRDIGAARVRRFSDDGAAVVVADLDETPAQDLARDIERRGGQALPVACDVSDRGSVASLFSAATARFGHVDFLVTCAGMLRFNLVQNIAEAEWDQVIDTHLKGTFLRSRRRSWHKRRSDGLELRRSRRPSSRSSAAMTRASSPEKRWL